MKTYNIELSTHYKYLSSEKIIVQADSHKDALLLFLRQNDIYLDVEEAEFSAADASVSLQSDGATAFFRFVEKAPLMKETPNAIEQREMSIVQKLIKKGVMPLYHGTKDSDLKVNFNFDNRNNDYGKGFYTTPDPELGKEWAYSSYTKGDKGYLYKFMLDVSGLEILDFTMLDSMHWVAELITNRTINRDNREALQDTIEAFMSKYKLDTSKYDVIIGYRADDSYFTYAEDFLTGAIYKDVLETALRNGNLGIQVFIKSEKAFERLKKVGKPEVVPEKYRNYYKKRDNSAREKYKTDRKNQTSRTKIRVYDLLR